MSETQTISSIAVRSKAAGWFGRIAACLFGALGAVAMPPLGLVPILAVSLTGLVWLMDAATAVADREPFSRSMSMKKAAIIGWWWGFGFFLAGLYWIGFAFLVEAESFAWMIPFVAVLMPGGLALFTAAAAALAASVWTSGPARILILAVALFAFEWLRGHVLTGFPWLLAGYAWSGSIAMLQSASVLGIYGLTLVTLVICCAPMWLFDAWRHKSKSALAAALLVSVSLGAMWAAGALRLSDASDDMVPDVRMRLVQPSVPQTEKWKPGNGPAVFATYLDMTAAAGFDEITHVIWPESSVPYILSREQVRLNEIAGVLGPERVLLAGAVRYDRQLPSDPALFFNSIHVIQGDMSGVGAVTGTYDKHHLVPFGEYLPFEPLLTRLGVTQLAYGSASGYSSGPGPRLLDVPGAPQTAPQICYEGIFPGGTVPSGRRPGWVLNVTNDAWFGDSSGPRQHFEQTRMRAVEQGLPLVRAANNGISAIIDPYGRIIGRLETNAKSHLDGPLPQALTTTTFSQYGDPIVLVLTISFMVIAVIWRQSGLILDKDKSI